MTSRLVLLLTVSGMGGGGACAAPECPPVEPAPAPLEADPAAETIDGAALPGMPLTITPGEELAAAEQAYSLGDPVRALAILDTLAADDPQKAKGAELLARAKTDAASMAEDWLKAIDGLIKRRDFRAARARGLYLLDHFPLTSETRAAIDERLRQVSDGVAEARQEILDLRNQAAEQLLRHDFVGAIKTLRRAEQLASAFNYRDALDIQRQITAAEFRFAQVRPLTVADGRKKAGGGKIKRRGDKEVGEAEELGPPPAENNYGKEIQELLRLGARHQKGKAYFQAIVAFEKVRELDSENNAAKVALEGLKPAREALIKEYLAKANEFFLKQDLAGAVPFFQRVRRLDPGNQEAEEGLKMYENLERIRQQREGKP